MDPRCPERSFIVSQGVKFRPHHWHQFVHDRRNAVKSKYSLSEARKEGESFGVHEIRKI